MNINISNASGKPIYLQIADQIKTLILEGKLKEGEMLPSMRNLALELRISFMTTKRAYEELEHELFREEQIKAIEALLIDAGERAQKIGITMDELHELLDLVNGGE